MTNTLRELKTPEEVEKFMSDNKVRSKCKTRFIFTTSFISLLIIFKITAILSLIYQLGVASAFCTGAMINITYVFLYHLSLHQPKMSASPPKIKRSLIHGLLLLVFLGFCGHLVPFGTGEAYWVSFNMFFLGIIVASIINRTLLYFTNRKGFKMYGAAYHLNHDVDDYFIDRNYFAAFLDGRMAKYTGACTLCGGFDGRELASHYKARIEKEQREYIAAKQEEVTGVLVSEEASKEEILNSHKNQLDLIRQQREEIERLQKLADKHKS